MQIKICGMRRPDDAVAAAKLEVTWVGVLVGQAHPSNDFLEPEAARRIVQAVRGVPSRDTTLATRVMLVTHLRDPAQVIALARQVGADGVQLHGPSTPDEVREIARSLPHLTRTLAVHMTGPEALEAGDRHRSLVDGFVLDSFRADTGQVGGTGRTHDWSLSRAFVQRHPDHRVWLAGGLHAGNVRNAIDTVQPAGVDVNSGTRGADGFKDPARMRAFVTAARAGIAHGRPQPT